MKTIRISKSRLSNQIMAQLSEIVSVSNETEFAFDATGTPDQLKSVYGIIDSIQSRNPFIK